MSSDKQVLYPENCVKVLDKGFVRLVDVMGDDSSITQAARVSYGKGTKQVSEDTGLIRYLMRHEHTTPFEMVEFKFHCRMPIFVARQWIRHRMASVNEYSGRYSEMPELFFVPEIDTITKQSSSNKQGGSSELIDESKFWNIHFATEQTQQYAEYKKALDTGMRKELARINLPLSQYTEWYWKIDLKNLFHFLKLRLDSHAQYEIQVYGKAIEQIIKPLIPVAYQAFEDYSVNAIKLSALEIKAFKVIHGLKRVAYYCSILAQSPYDQNVNNNDLELDKIFNNKREKEEFLKKIELLGYCL